MKKSLLSLGLLSTAMGVYVSDQSGDAVIGGSNVEGIYGAGSIIKHSTETGVFEVQVTDAALVDDNDPANKINTDLKLNAKLALGDGASDASKRVLSTKSISYWSGECDQADLNNPEGSIALGADFAANDVILSSKRNIEGSTTNADHKKLFGCLRLNNPDDGTVKHYGDLHVEVDIGIASKVLSTDYANEAINDNNFDYEGSGSTSIFLSEEWSLVVDEDTTFEGDAMENDGSNNGIDAQSLGDDSDGSNRKMDVKVPISSDHNLKVPDVSITHADFVSGDLRGATATMSIDDSKYAAFKGSKLETAAVTCTTGVTSPDLTVTCTVSGGADFTLPYDHVKQSYVSAAGCDSGLCGGKIEIVASGSGSGGLQGDWYGAGISAWATSDFDCAHPAFTPKAIAKDFFDSPEKDLSDILTAGTEKRVCELGDTLTFVKPSDDNSLVSGCDGGAQVVGDAASIDAGLNFISNKYGQCKVAEPGEFIENAQVGEVIGIQASCSDGVSADETACSGASGTWRAAVTSGDLFRNTKRLNYVYGESDISSGTNMKTSYTSSSTTFLQTQTTRTCTASTGNNLVTSKQTDFETAKTDFENSGTLDFTLAAGDVEFNEGATNTKTQGGKTLRARCNAEPAQVSLTCILDDKTDISDPQTGFTASATVEAPQTSVTVSYDLLKDDVSQSNSGVATTDVNNDAKNGDARSTAEYKKSISYTGFDGLKTYKIALTSDKNGEPYAFNCGNGGDVETYTGSTDLPCDGEQALAHEVTTWVRYTDDDLKVTPAFESGKGSIKESTGYGELTTKTIAGALKFSSTAITNDISIGTLTGSADNEFSAGLTSTAPATVAGTMSFAANNCQYATDKIVCDLVITGSRDNIYGGADEAHTLAFAPKYQHHKTGSDCESGTKASLADSAVTPNNGLTFTFEKEVDLYRGGVKVRDNDNYATQGINTNRAGWTAIDPGDEEDHITEAEIINYAIKMDVAGVVTKPEISFDVLSDGASSCPTADRKLFFDPLKLEFVDSASTTYPVLDSTPVAISGCSGDGSQARYQFQSDCEANGGLWSSTDYHTVTVRSGADTLKPKLKPIAAYDDDGIQAGESMVQFGVYVQQCGDDETRRKIVLNIQSALADSTPAVGVAVTADFDKQSSYLLNSVSTDQNSPTEITDLANAYTKWNEVTLFFQHFQDGETDTVQGDKDFELDNGLCPHDKFTADDKVYTIGTTQPTGIKFTKSSQCTTVGRIGFSFDGQCHYVKIPCKRHATTSDLDLSLSLSYGVTYSTTTIQVTTDTDKTVDLGTGASCSSNGVVTHATGSCTNLPVPAIAVNFDQVLTTFKNCGTASSAGDQTTWTMNLVQGITKNSQDFCNARPLSLSVIHKGRNSAKISILGLPELDIQLALTNLAYETCTDGNGASGHQVVFKIVDATTGTVITAENSKINGVVTQSQFDLTAETVTSYTGTCQDYCGTAQTVVAFDFDAKGSKSNQDFYADVSGDLTLTGDPCTGSHTETFTAQLQSAALGIDASCKDSTSYDSSTSQVATDGTGCFKLSPTTSDYAGVFAPVSTSVKSGSNGNLVADASITVSNPVNVGTDYYYSISDLLSLAGKEVELTVEWQYSIGSRRLRTTTTYLLGSSDHHSSAGIQILPAGVQVQEQIEAAPSLDVTAPAPSGVEDHSHDNTALMWGVIGVGGVGFLWVMITGFVRMSRGGDFVDLGGKKEQGYQRVGRFQSNLAF